MDASTAQDAVTQQAFGGKELFYDWFGANSWLFRLINDIRGDEYDALMLDINQLADSKNFPLYMMLMLVYVLGSAIVRKQLRRGGSKQYIITWFCVLIVTAISFIMSEYTVNVLKNYFQYPRPYVVFGETDINLLEQSRSLKNAYRSFPSGHVSFMAMMIASLWPVLSPVMRIVGAIAIFMAAWTRVSLGMHFPADTAGSLVMSLSIVLIVRACVYNLMRNVLKINC